MYFIFTRKRNMQQFRARSDVAVRLLIVAPDKLEIGDIFHRFGKVEPLNDIAPKFFHAVKIGFAAHTFLRDFDTEIPSEVDDIAQDDVVRLF